MSQAIHHLIEGWAGARGYRWAWGSPSVVEEVREEIYRRKDGGELDPGFYDAELGPEFRYGPSLPLARFASVLMLAAPRPAHLLRFETGEGPVDAVVPPTYVNYGAVERDVRKEIESVVGAWGHVVPLSAPYKAIAARTGLVRYGRNNVTYTAEFGSYQQLVCFATDFEPGNAAVESGRPLRMDDCDHCQACQRACPMGAIGGDRFLLHAERCLTFLNEYPKAWPDSIPASAHNAIEGCMTCQVCCPANKGKLRYEALQQVLSLEETRAILEETDNRNGPVWDGIRAKLASAGLLGLDTVLSRNLRALLGARKPS